jgi:hypothetical protein
MAAKRSLLDEIGELVSTWQAETAASSTNSPAISPSPSKKARKTSITPTQAKHDREDDSSSPRARFALMIIEYGIAHIPKDLVEAKVSVTMTFIQWHASASRVSE